ncbi:ComEC/Rec2 family competence protein [candidate division WWE3 bacterium]|uniref:ComEC/Rec2 family competence protein n=1 Tax=candidate division WWE3 bacterium TaxID=2053526 RepID=A0A955RQM7_UNCKA|nr:ComEC/Rec2 family competence protein [candidate division WWE3 bacterium]
MRKVVWFVLMVVFFFATGFVRCYQHLSKNEITGYVNTEGYVRLPPVNKGTYDVVEVKLITGHNVSVFVSRNEGLTYGDNIGLSGDVEVNAMYFPQVEKLGGKTTSSLTGIIVRLKRLLAQRVNNVFREPYGGIVAGVVFGLKDGLSENLNDKLRQVGIIHIIVASGYNVSVVVALVNGALTWLSRKLRVVALVGAVFMYMLITGFEPPIVRAGIMAFAAILGTSVGRQRDGMLWLIYAAMAMLLVSPLLYSSVSFLLSFAATFGILVLAERLEKLLMLFPNPLRQDMATTFAAQVGVAPILIASFGSFSLTGLIVNPLVLWTIPSIMLISIAALVCSFVSVPIGMIVGTPAVLLINWMLTVVNLFYV